MRVICLTPKLDKLKDEIREVIAKHTNEDIHISVVYYETNTYKKPLKKKK